MDSNNNIIYNIPNNLTTHVFNKLRLKKHDSIVSNNITPIQKISAENKQDATPQKRNNKGVAIGIGAFTLGVGILALSKGVLKNTGKYLNKFKEHLEAKLEAETFGKQSKWKGTYEYAIKKLQIIIDKSESINNVTSLKDILFMKLMSKTKPTAGLHKFISNIFENLSRKTIINSYKNTGKSFDEMYKIFDNLDNFILKENPDEIIEYKGKQYTKRELITLAKGNRESINLFVNSFISPEAQNIRYKYIKDKTSTLYEKFWDASFRDFWTKNNKFKRKEMWQSFIAADQIKEDKAWLEEQVAMARSIISYTAEDRIEVISRYIKSISEIVSPSDKHSSETIKKLKWFLKNPDGMKNNRDIFIKELDKLTNTAELTDDEISKSKHKSIQTYTGLIKDLLQEQATGEIQDMLEIYYKIAPFELSQSGAALAIKKAVQSFDKSVTLEATEFFDKVRDLVLGSAPTDILTILGSFGMIIYGLGYAKDGDRRISVMLNSGIPIVGAIGVTLVSTTKLISGGKSLALGAISGIILSKLGTYADKYRQKLSTEHTKKNYVN